MSIKLVGISLILSIVTAFCGVTAQKTTDAMVDSTTSRSYLLNNYAEQIRVADAMDYMYNFQFDSAAWHYNLFKYRFPEHPLPYFLLGLNEWWKIVPYTENEAHDDAMMDFMKESIRKSEAIIEEDEDNSEALFLMAAAYGFVARLHGERSNWTRSAYHGKSALNFFERTKKLGEFSPELLFGDGLYNYYSVWIPDNYPWLKPILVFFKKGDKNLGLEQLRQAAYNSFYTRVEAQYFLMRILSQDENDIQGALTISELLFKQYPENPYFHRYYARTLYTTGQYVQAAPVCKDLLERVKSGQLGYEETSGRYAGFFLGQIYDSFGNDELAKEYYQQAITYSEQIEATGTGYYLYSLLSVGEIAFEEKNYPLAINYFKRVKKAAKRKHPAFSKAKAGLKKSRKAVYKSRK